MTTAERPRSGTRARIEAGRRDAAAQAAHKETAHYAAWAAKTAEMFAEPRTRQLYRAIDPADGEW